MGTAKCLLSVSNADVSEDRIWSEGQAEPWEGALNNNNTIKTQVVQQWATVGIRREARGQEGSYAVE